MSKSSINSITKIGKKGGICNALLQNYLDNLKISLRPNQTLHQSEFQQHAFKFKLVSFQFIFPKPIHHPLLPLQMYSV